MDKGAPICNILWPPYFLRMCLLTSFSLCYRIHYREDSNKTNVEVNLQSDSALALFFGSCGW